MANWRRGPSAHSWLARGTMDATYRPPCILHLTGITLKDYVPIEDVADDKVLDAVGSEEYPDEQYRGDSADHKGCPKGVSDSVIPYDKIPKVFTSLEDWPIRTNLRCFEYNITFDDRPKFIPTYIRVTDDGSYEIGVCGNFCTFNAVALHINKTVHNTEERWRTQDMLKFVYNLFTGKTVSHIEPGPSKYRLSAYGGEWDEETLWKEMRRLDPVHGLKDHTPGSVLSERERMGVSAKKTSMIPVKEGETVWNVCRRAAGVPAVESLENQSVSIDSSADPAEASARTPAKPPARALGLNLVASAPGEASLRADNVADAISRKTPATGKNQGGPEDCSPDDLDSIIAEMIGSK